MEGEMCSSMLIASQGERERVSLDVTGSYVMLRLQRTMQEWLHGKDRFRSVQRNKKDTIANCNGDLKRTNTHRRSCTHPRNHARKHSRAGKTPFAPRSNACICFLAS